MKIISILSIKKVLSLRNIPDDLKKENSHSYSQIYNTYLSLFFVQLILAIYMISYFIMKNYLLSSIFISVFILGLISFILFIINPLQRRIFAANLTIFILLATTYPMTLFTGGINSSTIIWFSMYPAMIVFTTNIKNAAIWFILSILSLTSFYFLKDIEINKFLIGSTPRIERYMDLLMLALSLFSIIYSVDRSNKNILKKLETTQSKLEILATTDPLTGLYNRRFFEERAEIEIKRSIRYNKNLTLLMLDLDFFKKINDKYGHKAGDYVLKEVSTIFKKNLRDIDLIGRYGGEEFIMLFPESDKVTTYIAAERIRKDIEYAYFIFNNNVLNITISIGLTQIIYNEAESLDSLTHRADEALYKSKENGRNIITTWIDIK